MSRVKNVSGHLVGLASSTEMSTQARIRRAADSDLDALMRIEEIAFPRDDPVRKHAVEGELEGGIATGQILVAEVGDERERLIAAYAQFHWVAATQEFFIEGVAVDPRHRGMGLAAALLLNVRSAACLGRAQEPPLAMTVSPRNVPMIRSALSAGFMGVDFLADYFGPGEDRIYFRNFLPPYARLRETLFIPVEAEDAIRDRLLDGYILSSCEQLPQGSSFRLQKKTHDDAATLSASEVGVSIGVSSALLAAFAFLFGLALVNTRITDGSRFVLGFGLLSTTFAMLIYGKSSGELSRIRTGNYNVHMQIGNALSEFGGYYCLLVTVPIVVVGVTRSPFIGIALGSMAALGLVAYQFTGHLCLLDRYGWKPRTSVLLKSALAALPLATIVEVEVPGTSLGLSIVILLALASVTICGCRSAERARHNPA